VSSIPLVARNPRIRQLKRLASRSKVRSEERAFVVEGAKLVADALASPLTVRHVFHAPGALEGDETLMEGLRSARERGAAVDCFEVDPSVLASALDAVSPQPVAAVASMPDAAVDLPSDGPLLVAVELRDPGNLGTLLRTAEAAGLVGVAIVGQSVDRFSPKVVRASAGSLFRLPIVAWPDMPAAGAALRAGGRTIVASVVTADAVDYDTVDLTNAAVMVGNEPHGLSEEAVALADVVCTIPLASTVESLNVAAAGAVLCFEAARQVRHGAG
jgi:TrmH family RNA methyltransferase